MAVVTLVAVALSFGACERVQGTQSGQPVTAVTARQAQQPPQPSAPAQMAVPPTPPSSPPASSPSSEAAGPKSAAPPPKVIISDQSQTLIVAQQSFRLLTHVQRIEAPADETVEWWELRDAVEHVVYRESYPVAFENGMFESTVAISANSFTTNQGSGILVHGMEEPSDPESGGWVRLFGFKYGRDKYAADPGLFGPFGPRILVEGKFLDIDTDSARAATAMHDVLKFRLWTGHFNIVYPVLINWITGKLQPAWRCIQTTSKGQVDSCTYPITVKANRASEPTFVRLFPEPDDGSSPRHVIVQPQSKIEYLEARTPVVWNEDAEVISFNADGDSWIRIRIDGVEGWIHNEEDFEAVGLPQSG